MLRRTKDSVDKDGQPILTLPPVETKVISVDLSDSEREFYDALLARSAELFDGFLDAGVATKSYFQILTLIVRLRQACDHISLTVRNRLEDEETMAVEVDGKLPPKNEPKTPVRESDKGDVLGSKFLEGLYAKFSSSPPRGSKRTSPTEDSSSKRSKIVPYVSSVAKALSVAVKENSTHVEEECPICLENPHIEDAVLKP
jgi:SNF2 family DNA or RNA helicase